jgi:F420-dependent oxidoreductase-like protein
MKLGLHYWNYSTPADPAAIAPTLGQTARIAEQAGIAGFTVMDHFFQMEQAADAGEPMLEGYTTLGFVAAMTQRMTLGLLVTGVTYRYPSVLAKTVTTLDVLSRGWARLGIGASWYEREQRGLGVPVVPVAERFERLEETLQICLQMWSGGNGPYQGRHYQLAETLCVPPPLSRPRPPILIGGGGEQKTLRLVARYADACNLFATTPGRGVPQARRAARTLRCRGTRLRRDRKDGPRNQACLAGPRHVSRRRGGLRGARHQRDTGHAGSPSRAIHRAGSRTCPAGPDRHRLTASPPEIRCRQTPRCPVPRIPRLMLLPAQARPGRKWSQTQSESSPIASAWVANACICRQVGSRPGPSDAPNGNVTPILIDARAYRSDRRTAIRS